MMIISIIVIVHQRGSAWCFTDKVLYCATFLLWQLYIVVYPPLAALRAAKPLCAPDSPLCPVSCLLHPVYLVLLNRVTWYVWCTWYTLNIVTWYTWYTEKPFHT